MRPDASARWPTRGAGSHATMRGREPHGGLSRALRRLGHRSPRRRLVRDEGPAQGLPEPLLVPVGRGRAVLLRRARRDRASTSRSSSRARSSGSCTTARYRPLRGAEVSAAYDSVMRISFDVKGGLLIRQMHHWAALVFVGAIALHMARVFFTGAFRRPRELNWVVGVLLLLLALAAGFTGYSLPDDLLSGTGLRITNAIVLAIPFVGERLSYLLFGGEWPGTDIIGRLYPVHILLIPAADRRPARRSTSALVWRQKHTQFAGPRPHRAQRRRRAGVAGVRDEVDRPAVPHRRRDHGDGRAVPRQRRLAVRPVRRRRRRRRTRSPTGTSASSRVRCGCSRRGRSASAGS